MSNASLELGGDNWAAKDGNLLGYAQGASSSKFVPREFTFTRGSNLAATRVAANGLIEKGRENLLLQSNQFDTTWGNVNTTETSGQAGYDGTNDAWLLSITASGAYLYQDKAVSGVQTFSFYAKEGTLARVNVVINASVNVTANFDLANGIVLGGSQNITSSISSIGNGWYRCSVTYDKGTTNRFRLYPAELAGGGTSGNIYIQDAQLEQGLVATDYIETGATTVQAGLLEDEPRIDYTGGTGSLLLEPSRTNLITQSEYFDDWTNSEETDLSVNNTTSPEGVQNAYSITPQATSNYHRINKSITIVSGNQYSFSFFAKANGNDFILLRTLISGGNRNVCFNISNGTIDFESSFVDNAIIEDYGNGWYRCSVVWTATTSGQTIYLRSQISTQVGTDDGINTFTGNGNGAYLFGAQMEQGSYPTSYIPNHSGGSVTRGAEGQSYAGLSSLIGQTEGTLLLEIDSSSNNTEIFSLNRSTANAIFLRAVSNVYGVYTYADGATYIVNTSISINDKIKIAIAYESGNFAIYANGSQVSTNNSNWTPNVLIDTLNFNVGGYISSKGKVNFNKVLLFPTALSDAQCSALTVEGLKEEILTSYIAAVDTLEDGAEARLDTYLQNLEDLIV